MKQNKKAATEIIAYVLLIGMAIALGTIVSIWIKSTAEKDIKDIVQPLDNDVLCNDVSFNLNVSGCAQVKVSNRGNFRIDDFVVRINSVLVYNGLKNAIDQSTNPGETKLLNNLPALNNNDEIELIPIVRNSTCSMRRVKSTCQIPAP